MQANKQALGQANLTIRSMDKSLSTLVPQRRQRLSRPLHLFFTLLRAS